MMKTYPAIFGILFFAVVFAGCSSQEEQAKSLEQLYAENGIPVKVKVLEPTEFSVNEHYFAKLSGLEESSEYAPIGDKIERVLYKVGDYVREGQVVITFPSDNPGTQYRQLRETYENAKITFERMQSLYQQGGISKQDFDNTKTQFEVAKANWEAIRQSIKVQAPLTGTITKINVQPSDNVEKEQELFTVAKLKKLKASVWVPEKNIQQYSVGQTAVAHWNGAELKGKVTQVNRSLNAQKQAFEVNVVFQNPDTIKQTGITADIEIETYHKESALIVDRQNIISRQNKSFVYVAKGDSAVMKPITIGATNGCCMEIKSGLKAGEKIITEGQLLLSQGKKINIKP